jgi:PmbA protein
MNEPLLHYCDTALAHAKRLGASTADAMAIHNTNQTMGVRNATAETIERAESVGLGIRVMVGQSSATLSTADLSGEGIATLVEDALRIAREAPADPYIGLADSALLATDIADLDLNDTTECRMETLLHYAKTFEAAGLAHADITNSEGAECSTSHNALALATSHGFSASYYTAHAALSCSLIAGTGDAMQRDYSYATTRKFSALPSPESLGQEAAERTLAKMRPRKLETQAITIIFDPRVARSLLGAFAGAINGASIARGTSFLKDALGTAIFAGHLNIHDDPLRKQGLASRPFDAEGVRTTKQCIVENGVLKSFLLDCRSATQLSLQTTGHASRGLSSAPSPSASNLYIAAGVASPETLLRESGRVFYVTETFGHGVNIVTGDYSQGASGFYYENGVQQFPVSEVTIAGNLRDMFLNLTPANDLAFRYGLNSPTLRIEGMTLAGAA